MTSVHLLVSVVILDQLTSVHLSDEFLGLFEGISGSVRSDYRPMTCVHLSDEFLGLFEGIGGSVRCDSRPLLLVPV